MKGGETEHRPVLSKEEAAAFPESAISENDVNTIKNENV
jgi:hypothetical protein